MIRLARWEERVAFRVELFAGLFRDGASAAALGMREPSDAHHHWACTELSTRSHKSQFALQAPRLKLARVLGGSLRLDAVDAETAPHLLVVSNATLRLVERADVEILLPRQTRSLALDARLFLSDRLDLGELAPNQLCRVATRAALEIEFHPPKPGLAILCSEAACTLDLRDCFAEYWTLPHPASPAAPYAYVVRDADVLQRLEEMVLYPGTPPSTPPPSPERYARRGGFSSDYARFRLLRTVKFRLWWERPEFWLGASGTPDEHNRLRLMRRDDRLLLMHDGYALALVEIGVVLQLTLIDAEEAVPMGLLDTLL